MLDERDEAQEISPQRLGELREVRVDESDAVDVVDRRDAPVVDVRRRDATRDRGEHDELPRRKNAQARGALCGHRVTARAHDRDRRRAREERRAERRERSSARDDELRAHRAATYRVFSRGVHVFGLTGGIASGKSAVAARFRERGLPVIDADALSREVATPGSEAVRLVAETFGAEFVAQDGALERKKLSASVFGDDAKVRKLNAIMLPRIAALTAQRTQEIAARGEPLACYEAALIVENKVADAFRPLVVVSAPLEVQVARTKSRDALDERDVRNRIAAQLPLEEKIKVADIVIHNDGTLEALRARADDALDEVCRVVGVDPMRYPR